MIKPSIPLACGLIAFVGFGRAWAADGGVVITRAEDEKIGPVVEQVAVDELRLMGMAEAPGKFMLFVSLEGAGAQQVQKVGARVGKFELVGFDFKQEYADFRSPEGAVRRVWLPQGSVKAGNAGATLLIPPLGMLKGVIGLEEARSVARARGQDVAGVEKRTRFGIERQINDPKRSWEERAQLLADLIGGKQQHILCPPGGVDAAFARKYGLSQETVASANWGETAGMALMKGAKPAKDSTRP